MAAASSVATSRGSHGATHDGRAGGMRTALLCGAQMPCSRVKLDFCGGHGGCWSGSRRKRAPALGFLFARAGKASGRARPFGVNVEWEGKGRGGHDVHEIERRFFWSFAATSFLPWPIELPFCSSCIISGHEVLTYLLLEGLPPLFAVMVCVLLYGGSNVSRLTRWSLVGRKQVQSQPCAHTCSRRAT